MGYVTVEAVEAGYNRWHGVSGCVGYALAFSNGRSIYVTGDTSTDVAEVMGQFIKEGKTLHWGLSTVTEDVIRRAHAVCPVTAIQNIYSMLERDTESLFPVLEELHIGLVTHCPLAKGFLTAAYDKNSTFPERDWRGRMELFTGDGICRRQAVLDLIRAKASEKNAMPAQIPWRDSWGKSPGLCPSPAPGRWSA